MPRFGRRDSNAPVISFFREIKTKLPKNPIDIIPRKDAVMLSSSRFPAIMPRKSIIHFSCTTVILAMQSWEKSIIINVIFIFAKGWA